MEHTSWGHGVLNVQQSIAVATEVKGAMWRITPSVRSIQTARQEAIRLGYMPASAGRRDQKMRGGPGAVPGRGGAGRGGRGEDDAPPSARGVGAHYPPAVEPSTIDETRGGGEGGGAGRGVPQRVGKEGGMNRGSIV